MIDTNELVIATLESGLFGLAAMYYEVGYREYQGWNYAITEEDDGKIVKISLSYGPDKKYRFETIASDCKNVCDGVVYGYLKSRAFDHLTGLLESRVVKDLGTL